jgi:hypothetical protein
MNAVIQYLPRQDQRPETPLLETSQFQIIPNPKPKSVATPYPMSALLPVPVLSYRVLDTKVWRSKEETPRPNPYL